MPVSIDLHVTCPIYWKWVKRNWPFFISRNFHMAFREPISICSQMFKSGSSNFFLNVCNLQRYTDIIILGIFSTDQLLTVLERVLQLADASTWFDHNQYQVICWGFFVMNNWWNGHSTKCVVCHVMIVYRFISQGLN